MPTEITMPKLGESVVEGTITRWLKRPGDRVDQYEPLLEVQTDKVDTEVPAPVAGVVRELAVPEGATVKVGTLIALLDDGVGTDGDGVKAAAGQPPPAGEPEAPSTSPEPAAQPQAKFVSPVVARMAAEHGLDLSRIAGTGLGGRVSKKDVERYLAADQGRKTKDESALPRPELVSSPPVPPSENVPTTVPPEENVSPAAAPSSFVLRPSSQEGVQETAIQSSARSSDDTELIPHSPMRRSIAEHMERSVRTAPHVTTVMEADLGRVLAHRERRRAEIERAGARLTLTPYFIQAVVAGLQAVPTLNSTWTDEGLLRHRRIHVGVAVALDEGLLVPVVRNADEKNVLGLARAVGDLVERARARRLQPGETQGGTFTITNHGVSGSLLATPIINQPQSGILGVGAVQKRAVVLTSGGVDSIAIRPMCYLSLTFDHRAADGATADRFLSAVRAFLEDYAE